MIKMNMGDIMKTRLSLRARSIIISIAVAINVVVTLVSIFVLDENGINIVTISYGLTGAILGVIAICSGRAENNN